MNDSAMKPLDESAAANDGAPGALLDRSPSLMSRFRVAWHNRMLDMRLAAGEPIAGDRDLTARAWQLTRPRVRDQLANMLMGAVRDGDELRTGSAVNMQSVSAARSELVALAARLRDPRPVNARGVALTRELFVSGSSPLFASRGPSEALRRYLREALTALD